MRQSSLLQTKTKILPYKIDFSIGLACLSQRKFSCRLQSPGGSTCYLQASVTGAQQRGDISTDL